MNTALAGGANLSYIGEGNNRYFVSYLGNRIKKELEEQTATENYRRDEGILNTQNEFVEIAIPGFSTQELFARPALSFQRNTQKSQLNLEVAALASQFEKVLNDQTFEKPNYLYWLPGFRFQSDYKSGRRISIRYQTNVNLPDANQLFPAVDSINQLAIYQGNIDLEPEYSHNVNLSWSLFDQFSFTSLFIRLNGVYTKDKISWSQSINDTFIKVTSPLNVDNDYRVSSYIDFTTPIRSLGLNINIKSTESWNREIVFINEKENINTNFIHNLSLNFDNRNKDKWAVRVGGSISLTDARFSVAESQNNVFFNTNYYADVRFTPSKRWNIEADANIINYNARSFDEAVSVPLVRASINYFFLQAEQASITLTGFDLLNQLIGFQRIGTTNYLLQREWNTLGRYVMVTVGWRIREK